MRTIILILSFSLTTYSFDFIPIINGALNYSSASYQTFVPDLGWGWGYIVFTDIELNKKQFAVSARLIYGHKYLPATTMSYDGAASEGYPRGIKVSGGAYFNQYLIGIPVGGYLIKHKLEINGTLGCGFSKPRYTFQASDENGRSVFSGCYNTGSMFTLFYEIGSRFWLSNIVGIVFNAGYSHLGDWFTIPYFNIGLSIKVFNFY
jgi:hypothetical protein